MIPLLPPPETNWTDAANKYRNDLHTCLFPRVLAWSPQVTGVTGTVSATFKRFGPTFSISILFSGATISSSGYVDIPINAGQHTIFNVNVGGVMKPAFVNENENRLYLPDWNSTNVHVSGTAWE